jgi:Bacterial Ig-like domain (group 3)
MLQSLSSTLARASALLALTAAIGLSAQTTINVGPGQPYTTIQSGIDAANAGDTVLVAPGTYYENIDFMGKAITVTGTNGPSGGAANTILDGSRGQNPAVIFRHGEIDSSILNGLTIQNGGFDGSPQPPNNYGTGGIVINEASPVISNNILTHNDCNAIQSNDSSPLIENNEIDNTLDPNGDCGFAGGSAIWISGSLSFYNGGSQTTTPPAMIVGNLIQNNTESGRADAGGNGGAAVAVWGGYASIIGNTIRNNLTLGDGGAILAFNTNPINIIENLIYGNQANTDGAISMRPPDSSVGPFIGIVASNTISGNMQTSATGGAFGDTPPTQVYLEGNLGQYVLINNIIVGSGADADAVACGSIYNYLSITPLVFDHNDLYNSDGAAYGGVCPDQTGTYGNISSDPKFSNPSANNYQLLSDSPAIDTGNNSAPLITSTDIAGSSRIQDATNFGYPVIDMGAYEFSGTQDQSPTVLDLTPSEYDVQPVPPLTFTIALTSAAGTPSGPVTIYEDNNSLATVLVGSSGTYVYTPNTLTPGLHAFVATYPGSGIFPPAVSVKFYLIIPKINTTLNLTSSADPSLLGQSVTFTITASAADNSIPTPVTLIDTTTNILLATLTPNASGVATYTTSSLSLGNHSLEATYTATSNYTSASAYLNQQVVDGNVTTTALACTPSIISIGSTSLFSATVMPSNGLPTGSITFTDNGISLGQSPLTNGSTSIIYTGQVAGTHNILATYVPTGSLDASSGSCSVTVSALRSTAELSVTPTSTTAGTPITLTATIAPATPPGAGTPTGNVTFYNGTTALNTTALTGGVASFTTTTLPTGADTLTCTYSGSSAYAASNCNNVTVTNSASSSAITLTSSLNPAPALTPITFTAQLGTGTSGGTIVFNINGQNITTTPNAAGTATTTVNTLTPGAYLITSTWFASGHALAVQVSLTQVVTAATSAPDFSFTGPPSVTFRTQSSASATLTLLSLNGFSATIAITCNPPLPINYLCTVNPTGVSLSANGTAMTTFTFQPNLSASNSSAPLHRTTRIVLASLFPLTLLSLTGLASRRRTAVRALFTFTLLAILTSAITACGPDHFIPATPPGTYPITFTATDQGSSTPTTHTLTLNAVITP